MAAPTDSGIYEIVNLVNGKRYIGSAVNIRVRWNQHRARLRAAKHHNRHLQASWTKHGEAAFGFRIIERCAPEDLIAREQSAIDTLKPEMNICPVAGSTLGRRHSQETRRKIGARKVGLKLPPRSDEYRQAVSAREKGRARSPEHMAALQEGRRAFRPDEEHRSRVSEALKRAYRDGRKAGAKSPEHRAKIAATLTGRKATPEHRANQAAAQLGKKRGPYKLKAREPA